jgi:hypothetical protein
MVLLSVLSWGSGKAAVQSDAAAKPASGQVATGPEARDTGNVGLPVAEARALLDHQRLDQLLVAARGGASAKLEDVRVALLLAIKEIDSRGKPGEPEEAAKYLQRIKASLIAQAYGNEAYRYDPLAAASSREAIRRGLIALQSSADDALLVYARMWVGVFDKDATTVARCQELLRMRVSPLLCPSQSTPVSSRYEPRSWPPTPRSSPAGLLSWPCVSCTSSTGTRFGSIPGRGPRPP